MDPEGIVRSGMIGGQVTPAVMSASLTGHQAVMQEENPPLAMTGGNATSGQAQLRINASVASGVRDSARSGRGLTLGHESSVREGSRMEAS